MSKLPWTQIVRTITTYRVHAALPGSHAQTSSQIGPPSVFPWVSRTRFSLQMAMMRFQALPRCRNKKVPIKPGNCTAEYTGTALLKKGIPLTDENLGMNNNNMLSHLEEDGLKMHDVVPTLYQRSVRWSLAQLGSQSNEPGTNNDHRIQVHLLHPRQRGLLSFISELGFIQINSSDGLVGFHGGSKSLSGLKTAAQETYRGRRICPSYQLRSILGLVKASYFHAYLLRDWGVPNSSRLQILEPLK